MKKIALKEWELCGFWPYTPLLRNSVETGTALEGVIPWIKATVPGGIYSDLYAAGLIDDPNYELNSLKCEWVENRWWIYKTNFKYYPSNDTKQINIVFKGIDYKATIYFNNIKLGDHEGMFTTCMFDISDIIKDGENQIQVLFEHAPDEMPQIGYTNKTHTQKARFNYKWDFSTRLVNIGLYDEVFIYETGDCKLRDIYIRSENVHNGEIIVEGNVASLVEQNINIKLECTYQNKLESVNDCIIYASENEDKFTFKIKINNPKLWYPNGHGEQPLYNFEVSAYDQGGKLSDQYTLSTGIRDVSYCMNENSPEDALPYTIVVNGVRIYCKGVNMVPLDMEYGKVTYEQYEKFVKLIKAANINLIRVWGGGIIESDIFYGLCDKYGIMIFQEFIQSSSGLNNEPCIDTEFLALLEKTSIFAVKSKRSFACHVIWSGGNELQYEGAKPVGFENKNIQLLNKIVKEFDPGKLFAPTSAFGPREYLDINKPGENYDVHGPWNFEGVKIYYEIYNKSDSLLHSEFGCDGMSNIDSLEKFLSPENIDINDMSNRTWRHHGEWWDTLARDTGIFGKFQCIEDFILASQFVQAQALQYALEANRSRAFENSGSIIWQANEPWPNVSCTSLIDYYLKPKLAYYLVGVAYRPIHASLKHHALVYDVNEKFNGVLRLHNDTEQLAKTRVQISVTTSTGERLYFCDYGMIDISTPCIELDELSFVVPKCDSFEVLITLNESDEEKYNKYLFFVKSQNNFCSLDEVKKYLTAWIATDISLNAIISST